MKLQHKLLLAAGLAGLAGLSLYAAEKAGPKLTCCEKAALEKKECKHKCCVTAHKQGKSCEKCNPHQEDLKLKKSAKKAEPNASK